MEQMRKCSVVACNILFIKCSIRTFLVINCPDTGDIWYVKCLDHEFLVVCSSGSLSPDTYIAYILLRILDSVIFVFFGSFFRDLFEWHCQLRPFLKVHIHPGITKFARRESQISISNLTLSLCFIDHFIVEVAELKQRRRRETAELRNGNQIQIRY